MFTSSETCRKWLNAKYSSWVCCQSHLRGSTAENTIKQVALKRLTDLYKASTSSCIEESCSCLETFPPQPLWSIVLIPRWKALTLWPPTRMSPDIILSVASLIALPLSAWCDQSLCVGKALPIESVTSFMGLPSGNPVNKCTPLVVSRQYLPQH